MFARLKGKIAKLTSKNKEPEVAVSGEGASIMTKNKGEARSADSDEDSEDDESLSFVIKTTPLKNNAAPSPRTDDNNIPHLEVSAQINSPLITDVSPPKKSPIDSIAGYFESIKDSDTVAHSPPPSVSASAGDDSAATLKESRKGDLKKLAKDAGAVLLTSVTTASVVLIGGFGLPLIIGAAGGGALAAVGVKVGVERAGKFIKKHREAKALAADEKAEAAELAKQGDWLRMGVENVEVAREKVLKLFLENKETAKERLREYVDAYSYNKEEGRQKIGELICGIIGTVALPHCASDEEIPPIARSLIGNGCTTLEGIAAFIYPNHKDQGLLQSIVSEYQQKGGVSKEILSVVASLCAEGDDELDANPENNSTEDTPSHFDDQTPLLSHTTED